MTTTRVPDTDDQAVAPSVDTATALRRAAARGTLAASIHNSQPWRFAVSGAALTIEADETRRLRAVDPMGRQLMISLGCALFNARVSLAADGYAAHVVRFPDAAAPDVVARIRVEPEARGAADPVAEYAPFLDKRQTNRRRFTDATVPDEVVDALRAAVAEEEGILRQVRTENDRLALARLCQRADQLQLVDPAYRAELRAWTTTDPQRRDGVQAIAVPHVDGSARDDVPIRDFDSSGDGWLPADTRSSRDQCLLLIGTRRETRFGWLRAGEAVGRAWLEVTRLGYVASPLTQVVEVASVRAALQSALGLDWYPHMLLRVGRAPVGPTSQRRRVDDVVVESSTPASVRDSGTR